MTDDAAGTAPTGTAGTETATAGPLIDPVTSTAAATWALFVGLGLLMLGNGLLGSLVGLRSQAEGFTPTTIGAVMTAYFVGYLAGGRSVVGALRSVGHIRVFAALASMASSAVLIYALAAEPALWMGLRFVTGFCMSGLYVLVESWINELATRETRGRLLALYMVVSMGGLAGGQVLLNLAAPDGFELLVLASVLVSLALVPVSLSASSSPPKTVATSMSIVELARLVPGGVMTSLSVGVSSGALLGMAAPYAAGVGLPTSRVALFVGLPMVGGVALQYPIGMLSDRIPRRGVIVAVASAAAVVSLNLALVEPGTPLAYGLVFLLGGMVFPLYSLSIAYTNDWLVPEQMLGASAALVMANGVGAVAGPVVASVLIELVGFDGFFWALVAANLLALPVLIQRAVFGDHLPLARQLPFVAFPARASSMAARLSPRVPRRANGNRRSGSGRVVDG